MPTRRLFLGAAMVAGLVPSARAQAAALGVTEEQYDLWRSENCGDLSAQNAEAAFDYLAQSTVAASVVDAWKSCMIERDGLSCWAEPYDDTIAFAISWRAASNISPTVSGSYLSNGSSPVYGGAVLRNSQKMYKISLGRIGTS